MKPVDCLQPPMAGDCLLPSKTNTEAHGDRFFMQSTLLAKVTHNKLQKFKGYFCLKSHTPPCSFDLWL